MSIKLIDNISTAHKLGSVQIGLIITILSGVGSAITATGALAPFFGLMPTWKALLMCFGVAASILLARILKWETGDTSSDPQD
jgi:hypothetical protein